MATNPALATTATVRPFAAKDAPRASVILIAAFRSFLHERFDDNLAAHFSPEQLLKTARGQDTHTVSDTFVAEDAGNVVGIVKVSASANGLGTFEVVGVDPECHARGIGSLLMAQAEAFWAEHKQRKIHTCVSAHNKKALMYYLKHDFIPEGYCRDHFLEGVDEIMLGRFLKRPAKT